MRGLTFGMGAYRRWVSGVSFGALLSGELNGGDGLALDFLTDTALVVDADSTDGGELVTNGGFDTDSDWTKQAGWTISGGTANASSGSASSLIQTLPLPGGGRFTVTFTISGITTGTVQLFFTGTAFATKTTNGTFSVEVYDTGANDNLGFFSANSDASIDNVSVTRIDNSYFDRIRDLLTVTNTIKHVTGPDGNLRYQAHNLYLNSASPANQSVTVVSGQTYKIAVTGTVSITVSGAATGTVTAGSPISFTAATTTLTCGSTSGTGTVQVFATPADETYVATTGSTKFSLALDHDVTTLDSSSTSVSVGTGKRTFTLAGSTDYRTATTAWAAASELVTNGGFDADTDWTKGGTWAISGGQASAGGSSGSLTQAISLTANTYYEVTYEVVSITSGNVKFQFQGGAANVGTIRSTPGTYTEVIENTDNDTLAFVSGGTTPDAVIDNVTITEYRAIGDQRQVNNRSYTCIVAHTSSGANKPSGEGNAFWKRDEVYLTLADQSDIDGRYMKARVDYQTGTTLVVDVLRAVGSGSASSWHVIECKGCLIEEARTNLWVYSEALNNATGGYSETNASPVLAYATGPDGLSSATRLIDDSGTGTGNVFIQKTSQTVSTATAYTFSVFAKADQLSWLALGVANFTTPASGQTFFNLSNGTVGTETAGTSGAVEDVGNGWYRCSITFTTDAADTTGNLQILVSDGDADITVDRDGTSSILIYGAQFEAGSFPTSYIATSGSTVARAADVISLATSDFAFDETGFTVFSEVEGVPSGIAARISSITDGTAGLRSGMTRPADDTVSVYVDTIGAANGLIQSLASVGETRFRCAYALAEDDLAGSAEGAAAVTDTSVDLITGVTTLYIGCDYAAVTQLNGHIRSLIYTPTRETNAALQARAA